MNINKSFSIAIFFILASLLSAQSNIPENPEDISPLLIGEKLPDCNLINEEGEIINLTEQIKKKNTVLVFYRGGWCPYCNLQLSGLATSEADIIKLGYQIIAVSPDDYTNLKPTVNKNKVNYNLYSDPDGKFIKDVGIAFTISAKTKKNISKKTIGEASDILPVPTVLVVNTEGEILFEYISPNYKQRISSELLLAVLRNLN